MLEMAISVSLMTSNSSGFAKLVQSKKIYIYFGPLGSLEDAGLGLTEGR